MSLVAAAPAECYADRASLRAALIAVLEPHGGFGAFVRPGARVLLKPNFVRALDPERGGLTHPAFVAEVARLVRDAGAGEVLVGDSPAIGSARHVARRGGFVEELEAVGARLIEFESVQRVATPDNGRFRVLSVAGEAMACDLMINLPKAKAHCQMVLTGAVKNLYGCIPGRRKALMHCLVKNSRDTFARMLIDNARALAPALTIMDGVVAMEGQGPTSGDPRPWGWVMAATDMVAMDRVMAAALGYEPDEIPHLVASTRMGYGAARLEDVRLVGAELGAMRPTSWRRAQLLPVSFNPLRLALGYLKHWRAWRTSSPPGVA